MRSNNGDSERPFQNEAKHCDICGSGKLDTSDSISSPICTDCGSVIHAAKPPVLIEKQQNPDDMATWPDVCEISNGTEQQISNAVTVIESAGELLNLSYSVRKQTADIYGRASLSQFTDGRSTELVVSAALLIATRKSANPRPTTSIATAIGVTDSSILPTTRLLCRDLGLHLPICAPEEYVCYLGCELGLSSERKTEARSILNSLEGASISGKHPIGFAAAAVYLALEGAVSQRTVARISGITEETVRVRLRDIGGIDP